MGKYGIYYKKNGKEYTTKFVYCYQDACTVANNLLKKKGINGAQLFKLDFNI